jgi:3-oxoacyl-[acyl-carrier protein] reductase
MYLSCRQPSRHRATRRGKRLRLEKIRAAGGDAVALKAGVRPIEACRGLIETAHARLGALDVLGNNAGVVVKRYPLQDIDVALYNDIVGLNARSVFACSRAAAPIMQARGGRAIISATSIAARTCGASKSTLYAASRAIVSTLTRGVAEEVARQGVRVNAVVLGVVGKPDKLKTTPRHRLEASIKLAPMRRISMIEECIGTYLFLASNAMSGFIAGEVIEVNGGLHMP